MIKLGIDARPITNQHLGGIGVYTKAVLQRLLHDDRFEVFCYANHPLVWFSEYFDKRHFRLLNGRPSAFFYRYLWGSEIKNDTLDVFWGTSQVLPRQKVAQREVVTVHDLALLMNPAWGNSRIDYLVERYHTPHSIRNADSVICVSESTSNDVDKYIGNIDGCKNVVHLGGPELNLSCCDNEARDIVPKGDYFVYFGDLNDRKNVDGLLRAFARVARQRTCRLVIGGRSSSSDIDVLASSVGAGDVRDSIEFVGFVGEAEKRSLLAYSSALVFPSRYEGFGLPVLEGMAAGTLVVTSRVSSLPEVAGSSAIYVDDPEDCVGLSNAMLRCLDMPLNERERRIEAGKKHAGLFSWDRCAAETVNLLAVGFE